MFIDHNYGFITGSDSGPPLENICPVKSGEQVERVEKQSSWQQSPGKGWVSSWQGWVIRSEHSIITEVNKASRHPLPRLTKGSVEILYVPPRKDKYKQWQKQGVGQEKCEKHPDFVSP